jgi:hypothetical protein
MNFAYMNGPKAGNIGLTTRNRGAAGESAPRLLLKVAKEMRVLLPFWLTRVRDGADDPVMRDAGYHDIGA